MDNTTARHAASIEHMLAEILGDEPTAEVTITGAGSLPAVFPVTELATASLAATGVAVSELLSGSGSEHRAVRVDRRLASLWFGTSLRPDGWEPPPPWDAVAGDYRASDGWIRLHTNAPAHRAAALGVLGVPAERERVAVAVAGWSAAELEQAVVRAGGCAAMMRTLDEWDASEAGRSVAAEQLIHWQDTGEADAAELRLDPDQPLAGVRVLDLTRVLAGPIATRTLANLGADVLRIDPPWWEEPGIVPEMMLGKRSARLDLRERVQRERFLELLAAADVLVHGYRPGALDQLGLDRATLEATRPGLIQVCLDAYGWSGPLAGRRGFDSLVQMSTGIAEAGMRVLGRDRPTPLPVQALDHATGYLMAHAAIRALATRLRTGRGSRASLSLARTARLLTAGGAHLPKMLLRPEGDDDVAPELEHTSWGPARRLRQPIAVEGVVWGARLPARELGSDAPSW